MVSTLAMTDALAKLRVQISSAFLSQDSNERLQFRIASPCQCFPVRNHMTPPKPVKTNHKLLGSGTASVPEKKNGSIRPFVLMPPRIDIAQAGKNSVERIADGHEEVLVAKFAVGRGAARCLKECKRPGPQSGHSSADGF